MDWNSLRMDSDPNASDFFCLATRRASYCEKMSRFGYNIEIFCAVADENHPFVAGRIIDYIDKVVTQKNMHAVCLNGRVMYMDLDIKKYKEKRGVVLDEAHIYADELDINHPFVQKRITLYQNLDRTIFVNGTRIECREQHEFNIGY